MKKLLLPAMLFTALSLVSCGGDGTDGANDSANNDTMPKEEPKASFADACKDASQVAITIKGYKYGMSAAYTYETANFEIKESSISWSNDSSCTLTLRNYKSSELVGDRKDDQVEINIDLTSRHGKKIGPATYKHGDTEADYASWTTMMTAKGKVYFNWVAGMPEQGTIKINFIDGDQACGSIAMSVEAPDNEQIGTVRIGGTFKTAE